jgi:DNA mismatch repair ATPase MutL
MADGTQISVEELFYNDKVRFRALRQEEYKTIRDLFRSYAVHYNNTILRLQFANTCDLNTSGSTDRVTTIRQLYRLPKIAEECTTVHHEGSLYTVDAILSN